MPARILNGNEIRDQIKAEVARDLEQLLGAGIRPGLSVILVGNDPASEIYTRNKAKTCKELGMFSERIELPSTITTEELTQVRDESSFLRVVEKALDRQS